jgi:hypothetical protein
MAHGTLGPPIRTGAGAATSSKGAGVFNVRSDFDPSSGDVGTGFRCAR